MTGANVEDANQYAAHHMTTAGMNHQICINTVRICYEADAGIC